MTLKHLYIIIAIVSEVTNEVKRDVSRADWQRKTGAVVMRELTEPVLSRPPVFLDPNTIIAIEHRARQLQQKEGLDSTWSRAYALSIDTFRVPSGSVGPVPHNEILEEQVDTYTFMHTSPMSFAEGMQSQQFFPLNLARMISTTAKERGVAGFGSESLGEIATVFRRPDFRAMIDQAAFTKNGMWRDFTSQISGKYTPPEGGSDLEIVFQDGEVAFSAKFAAYLRSQLSEVNRNGLQDVDVDKSSSSGCPAAHKRAHFTDNSNDQIQLQLLSNHFGKTTEELTQSHEKSIIQEGIERMTQVLEAADHYLQTGEVYLSRRPNILKRLAKQVFAFVRSR